MYYNKSSECRKDHLQCVVSAMLLSWLFGNKGVKVSLIAKEGPIIYREGRRKMIIESERVRPDGAIEVYTPTINNWEAPYEQDELTHEHKLKIMCNIQAKLQRQGEKVIRFT